MRISEELISEIRQIREQYVREVGQGRRVWPRAIRERVLRLIDLGELRLKQIAESSGVPYETVCQWKHQRERKTRAGFHSVPVVAAPESAITNASTVTASDFVISKAIIEVQTPEGYVIRGLTADSVVLVIRHLKGGA